MRDVVMASCAEEQAWNHDQLSGTVLRPAFRLFTYRAPALILGCSQRSLATPEQVAQRAGIDTVVRQAGGGAVLAGPWMLSASIVLPSTHPLASGGLVQSYRWIGELHASVLQELGIAAHAIDPDTARSLHQESLAAGIGWACFGGFSAWDVVVGQRKIAGLAQVRRRTGALFVAGVLLGRPDWELLSRALDQHEDSPALLAARTTSCAGQLERDLPHAELASRLADALRAALA